ncbi:MAG TPA: FtsX-like permease family protein [Gammaproteobacteria bacterium]|jgi:putative ABC transport system permease protein
MHPILSSLRHHKLTSMLLVLQVTLTCAIVCNVASLIATRIENVSVVTGVTEAGLSTLSVNDVAPGADPLARHTEDLALLRAIPGVQAVAALRSSLPLNQNGWNTSACVNKADQDRSSQFHSEEVPGCSSASIYHGGPGELATLGLKLVEGRDFQPSEYVRPGPYDTNPVPAIIISRSLAERIFPGQDALGKDLYVNKQLIPVVGIVETLVRPSLNGTDTDGNSMLYPVIADGARVLYILRSDPKDQAQVLRDAQATLLKAQPQRIINDARSYAELRHAFFQSDYTMIGLLLASALGLLTVTIIGIAGLAGFWVQQRTRQIGIRRAVGATRRDVLRHFQLENFMIVGTGVVLGLALAELFNMLLVRSYGVAPLPLTYLPVTALLLLGLGQLAVLNPALHASRIAPASAARNL